MGIIFRIIITVVFGFFWWACFHYVAPDLTYLMILGSVLAVCACCCQGGARDESPREFNYQHWFACIRRCWLATVTLMVALIILAAIVVVYMGGTLTGAVWTHILVAAIGAPFAVRLICCAYES